MLLGERVAVDVGNAFGIRDEVERAAVGRVLREMCCVFEKSGRRWTWPPSRSIVAMRHVAEVELRRIGARAAVGDEGELLPSGDHAGCMSAYLSSVSWRTCFVSRS